ncbi:glycosyl hydrolase [Ancylomarina sp. 16SWW S1-10-2]|uniref:WD40/YVTN/BNR-like repeat-containing protein n=1 Tax=Ancylomarina sp. 16SWW S1-10-2 TaxID=2499681 RepID=UPI0012AD822D|nr:glycosyl hydrolase [Ancylomarina sp. 16SWW S1-10-2]MRT91373.1 glycosyl hydrolase [Ancylomarina sp. 16SWW S1-10-2]
MNTLKRQLRLFSLLFLIGGFIFSPNISNAKKKQVEKKKDTLINSQLLSGLKFRGIGPATTSGRIADFAVNPNNHSEYYVAVASGNIFKTTNNGTTWKPVFDKYGSYSIGVVTMDPNNSNVVWAGTGENNHQRALGYGDGVYKTMDGGKSWKNMGLKESRHIGGVVIDPRNSDIVFVAAEGSAWGPGGDRGLYKTVDGGNTWKKVITISENTGVNNVIIDPVDPDIMYATSEQRRRHVYAKINGGPESAIYKSTDAGETWRILKSGLPSVDKGGMGIAVSPVNHNYVYAIIEAAGDKSGFFRSTDRGESWTKMSSHASSGQYYNEIYCDPIDADKVYSVETYSHVTTDGGKTWTRLGLKDRHVDDHAIWIDPTDTNHFMIGGDGGLYESFDAGLNYIFKSNLSVTQFYHVQVDNALPFYNIYGGTQDNNTLGGPSRNTSRKGVTNAEWAPILGGDGFWAQIDPLDPNIVYCESQYGNSARYDKKSGEKISIKPQERKGELSYKWNWNAPLIISSHKNTRLYAAANKLFRSDDRGNSWQVISEDLCTGKDRDSFKVMGKYWGSDAVKKHVSTSQYGTIVSLAESPKNEDLLYVGTDDGLVQVTQNGGELWEKNSAFTGVPSMTYISDILPSKFDENVVYASFDNRKRDDFKPYILKSSDKGKTWVNIASNLPKNGTVHTIEQDFIDPNLLFVGTEFGIFFTNDEGENWIQLKAGIPTIAVRDLTIQKREGDLVAASFGRGFFIFDDYAALRSVNLDLIKKDAHLFPVKDALMYIENGGKSSMGATYFTAPNPKFGATFTYYLKDVPKTTKQVRQEKEKKLLKSGDFVPQASWKAIEDEAREIAPYLVFTIKDADGSQIRKITSKAKKGINRLNWDLKFPSLNPVKSKEFKPTGRSRSGMFTMPGSYQVEMGIVSKGDYKVLAGPVKFNTVQLNNTTLPAENRSELVAFQQEVSRMSKAIQGSLQLTEAYKAKLAAIRTVLIQAPTQSVMATKVEKLVEELAELDFLFNGVQARASSEEIPPAQLPISNRINSIVWAHWASTSGVTQTEKDQFEILKEEFPAALTKLQQIASDLKSVETELEKQGAAWTPGRVPTYKVE